jgi:hypothetical protein
MAGRPAASREVPVEEQRRVDVGREPPERPEVGAGSGGDDNPDDEGDAFVVEVS